MKNTVILLLLLLACSTVHAQNDTKLQDTISYIRGKDTFLIRSGERFAFQQGKYWKERRFVGLTDSTLVYAGGQEYRAEVARNSITGLRSKEVINRRDGGTLFQVLGGVTYGISGVTLFTYAMSSIFGSKREAAEWGYTTLGLMGVGTSMVIGGHFIRKSSKKMESGPMNGF